MKKRTTLYLVLSGVVTAYLVAIVVYRQVVAAPLPWNEMGDTLAGIFSPLAFFLLAVAVYLQNKDLDLTRKEMEEQREVFKQQAQEAKTQAEYIGAQTQVVLADFERKKQDDALRLFEMKASALFAKARRDLRSKNLGIRSQSRSMDELMPSFFQSNAIDPEEMLTFFKNCELHIRRSYDEAQNTVRGSHKFESPLDWMESAFEELLGFEDQLSPAGRQRLSDIRVAEMLDTVQALNIYIRQPHLLNSG